MKFTIRDLFLVTVIVALGLGWWIDRQWLRPQRQIRLKQLPYPIQDIRNAS